MSEVVDGTVEYAYCAACDGALRERIERDESDVVLSWLRYEYEGLDLLRIDEVYDYDEDTVLEDPAEGDDRWRPLNVYTHGPGSIGQIIRNQTYSGGSPSTLIYYYYDALGNVVTVSYTGGHMNWQMEAFGNRIPGSQKWAPIDSNGPKARLTGKMYDEDTGLYYFHARWLDPQVGRFVSRDPAASHTLLTPPTSVRYSFCLNSPSLHVDPTGLLTAEEEWEIIMEAYREAVERLKAEGYKFRWPDKCGDQAHEIHMQISEAEYKAYYKKGMKRTPKFKCWKYSKVMRLRGFYQHRAVAVWPADEEFVEVTSPTDGIEIPRGPPTYTEKFYSYAPGGKVLDPWVGFGGGKATTTVYELPSWCSWTIWCRLY